MPVGSSTDEGGEKIYFPDISGTSIEVIQHWSNRAIQTNHPVLKARYADLVWELTPVLTNNRRDPAMARYAIQAYLSSATDSVLRNPHDRFDVVLRALDLSCLLHDENRIKSAKELLLYLHRVAVEERNRMWWIAYDRLMYDKNAGLTKQEMADLADSLEDLVLHFGDTSDPTKFDPHELQDVAKRLIQHYVRLGETDEVRRLNAVIGQGFEHFASLGDAMLASSVLQTAVNAYHDAGMFEDNKRVRILMQKKIRESRTEMVEIKTEFTIPYDDLERFSAEIVNDDLGLTFAQLAFAFLPNKKVLEEQVRTELREAPVMAHIPQAIMADDHVAGKIGSVEDDPHGRLVQRTTQGINLSSIWMRESFKKLFSTHTVTPHHFAGWANRLGIFEDVSFLIEGFDAWFAGDMIKAVHILVPQAECGLRGIVSQLSYPVTKSHRTVSGVSVALTMGDVLYSNELTNALGPDLTLYLLAVFADPRGINLRNDVAHGLIKHDHIKDHLVHLLIHTFLVFGVWKEISEKRR